MAVRAFERRSFGTAELDLCFDCHAIWFDASESVQLTPGSVIELFRLIHEYRDAPQRPLADSAQCPRCSTLLKLTHDIQRTTRITYYRCEHGHGRLTTFFQFLREKNFIRSLSGPEIDRLRATIRQVRCSSCGGPVSVERDAACPYCRSPLSILDAEAVDKALATLSEQEAARRRKPDPTVIMDAALASQRFERTLAQIEGRGVNMNWGVDLVGEALGALLAAID
jgi:hypothetical protein